MAQASAPAAAIAAFLQGEGQRAQALAEVLNQEADALTGADPEAILAIAQAKGALVTEILLARVAAFSDLKRQSGLADESALRGWILDQPEQHPLRRQWGALVAQLQALQDRNRVNGLSLQQQASRSQEALALLMAHGSGAPSSAVGRHGMALYGPQGGR